MKANPNSFHIALDKTTGVVLTTTGMSKKQFHRIVSERNRDGAHFTFSCKELKNRFRP